MIEAVHFPAVNKGVAPADRRNHLDSKKER